MTPWFYHHKNSLYLFWVDNLVSVQSQCISSHTMSLWPPAAFKFPLTEQHLKPMEKSITVYCLAACADIRVQKPLVVEILSGMSDAVRRQKVQGNVWVHARQSCCPRAWHWVRLDRTSVRSPELDCTIWLKWWMGQVNGDVFVRVCEWEAFLSTAYPSLGLLNKLNLAVTLFGFPFFPVTMRTSVVVFCFCQLSTVTKLPSSSQRCVWDQLYLIKTWFPK